MSEPGPRPGRHRRRAIVTRQPVIGGAPVSVIRPRYGREVREYRDEPPIGALPGRLRGALVLGTMLSVVAIAFGAGVYYVYASSLLRVKVAEVEGAALTSPNDLAAQAALFNHSLVTADLSAAEARVEQLPLVKDATIERHWPRTIRIVVTERQPCGVWEQSGVAYTIDRDGVVLGTGTAIAPPPGAPVIRSFEQGSRIQGEKVDASAVEAASRIWTELPARLGVAVTEVAFLVDKGVQVTTDDGQVALLGDASGIDYKLAAWAAMAQEADERGIVYRAIDLRFGNRPVLIQ
jgi:cell division septal protein FtsQ